MRKLYWNGHDVWHLRAHQIQFGLLTVILSFINLRKKFNKYKYTYCLFHTQSYDMRTLILLFLFIATISISAYGQGDSKIVQIIEGEVKTGITTPIGSYHSGKSQISASLSLEGRYNFKGTSWDMGLMLDLSTARRSFEHLYNGIHDRWQNNRTFAISLTSNHNFRQGAKFNPFIGTAVGVAFNDVVGDKCFPSKGTSMILSPRVGIEFFHHFRITTQFNLCRKGYNNLCLSIGFIVGGHPQN